MGCSDCERIQDEGELKSYYRWKNANIEMVGCAKHLKEIYETLNRIQGHEMDSQAQADAEGAASQSQYEDEQRGREEEHIRQMEEEAHYEEPPPPPEPDFDDGGY